MLTYFKYLYKNFLPKSSNNFSTAVNFTTCNKPLAILLLSLFLFGIFEPKTTTATQQAFINPDDWVKYFVEYSPPQTISAPNGFEVKTAISLNATTIKVETNQSEITAVGYVETNGLKFYMTVWSFNKWMKGSTPNWVIINQSQSTSDTKVVSDQFSTAPAESYNINNPISPSISKQITVLQSTINQLKEKIQSQNTKFMETAREANALWEKLFKDIANIKLEAVYITNLSFIDTDNKGVLNNFEALLINNAVIDGINQAIQTDLSYQYNAKDHTISNTVDNAKKLASIYMDINKTASDIYTDLQQYFILPFKVNIIITGRYQYDFKKNVIYIAPILITSNTQDMVTKILKFPKTEYICTTAFVFKSLCHQTHKAIADAVKELLDAM